MKMRLHYFIPETSLEVEAEDIDWEERGVDDALDLMVRQNPEIIFFFTVASTDIWSTFDA